MPTAAVSIAVWLADISLVSAVATIYDKISASRSGPRVPEKTLLLLSAAGGSAVMYLTMKAIRHKTRHRKFMIGIPVIMILQAGLLVALYCVQTHRLPA